MRAASGMNVVVTAVETVTIWMDPTLQADYQRRGALDGHFLLPHKILRPAGRSAGVNARRQLHGFAVVAVDLWLKEEIRSNPFRLRRIDAALGVTELKPRGGGFAVVVTDVQLHLDGRPHIEQHGRLAAESDVLRASTHIEADRRLTLARFAA